MAYIALKRMKVGTEFREPGDPMPEAADWPWTIRDTYLRNAYLKEMPDPPEPAAVAKPAPVAEVREAPALPVPVAPAPPVAAPAPAGNPYSLKGKVKTSA